MLTFVPLFSIGAWNYARIPSVSNELKMKIVESFSTSLTGISSNGLHNILHGLLKFNVNNASHFSLKQLEHFDKSLVERLQNNDFDKDSEFILLFKRYRNSCTAFFLMYVVKLINYLCLG